MLFYRKLAQVYVAATSGAVITALSLKRAAKVCDIIMRCLKFIYAWFVV